MYRIYVLGADYLKIALLTMFNGLSSTYSLVNVVAEQLTMFIHEKISVKVLVSEDCPLDTRYGIFLSPLIEWVSISNHLEDHRITWYDYTDPLCTTLHPTFSIEVQMLVHDFVQALYDVDICIMHDILYQGWHYIHNIAIRLAQKELPLTRFIAFTHSLPVQRPTTISPAMQARFFPMPRTLFAYPTYSGIPLLSKQYAIPEAYCRVVYNSLSLLSFLSPEVTTLHQIVNLLDSDLLIVYPGRFSPSKKFEKVAALAGSLAKKSGKFVKVIFCDFNSLDIDSTSYKALIKSEGIKYGLSDNSIFFTSDHGFKDGFPRQGVLDLFTLSNLFICPSFSESFGLTVLEAASRGNFLILNENVPALYELGTRLHAYFMRWDARGLDCDLLENYMPSENAYYEMHADTILNTLFKNNFLYAKNQVRLCYNTDWIWKHQLKPLLESALLLD